MSPRGRGGSQGCRTGIFTAIRHRIAIPAVLADQEARQGAEGRLDLGWRACFRFDRHDLDVAAVGVVKRNRMLRRRSHDRAPLGTVENKQQSAR